MFVDKVQVVVKAGNGGNGVVSFRHEKFVDRGGPDGGDGGRGGSIIFKASRNQNTLAKFRFQKRLEAEPGANGFKKRQAGRSGADLTVDIPVGTAVTNEAGELLADLIEDGQEVIIAKGGQGGFGNAHFVSSTRQAPRIAEKGEPGDELKLQLELKMLADVGLVGLPNAGKSTLLARISNAQPEIANYPFTTLTPNLGVVDVDDDSSLLFADIPGLIEGASQGKGLGDEFLRHVERNKVLLHLIDAYQENIAEAYQTIQKELADYTVDLSNRPQIVAITKIEGLDEEMVKDRTAEVIKVVPTGTKVMAISAQSGQGIKELLYAVKDLVEHTASLEADTEADTDSVPVIGFTPEPLAWEVAKTDEGFLVTGHKIEKFAARTHFESGEGVARLRDIMRKMGILHELARQGAQEGDIVTIGKTKKGSLTL